MEFEYQFVYHFGDSEWESKLILIYGTNKWYAQIVSGSWSNDNTELKWIYEYENLTNVRIRRKHTFNGKKYK